MKLPANAYLDARLIALAEGCVTTFRVAEATGQVRYKPEQLGLIEVLDRSPIAEWLRTRETARF